MPCQLLCCLKQVCVLWVVQKRCMHQLACLGFVHW